MARITGRAALLAQYDRRPALPRIQLGSELLGNLARHPADLLAASSGMHSDRVLIVLPTGVAAQLERRPRSDVLAGDRLGVVLPGARGAGHPQAARG